MNDAPYDVQKTDWLLTLYALSFSNSGQGIQSDLSSMTVEELRGVYVYLRRIAHECQ